MTITVIRRALLRIAQHGVSLATLLELLLSRGVVRIPIRMMLHRQLAISRLQLRITRIPRNTQYLVVINLCHVRRSHIPRISFYRIPNTKPTVIIESNTYTIRNSNRQNPLYESSF